jgi:4-aminobutyrate aminotransferase/diaminobutyrate-pyruvate transaminase/4-aminobutyrate aminotransferase/(S)-3-amino-2-methylpropionate transaminase
LPEIKALRAAEPVSMQGMPPVIWNEAEGFLVRDGYGNQWIDLTSGIVAANAGHSHPKIRQAIHDAVDRKLLFSYAFPTQTRRKLLQKLVSLSPIKDSKAIVFSTGTEVTECAMMLMRRRGREISAHKIGILSFRDSYHGRTLAAQLAAGTPGPDDWIQREKVNHYQVTFPFCPRCPWGMKKYDNCGKFCFRKCLEELEQQNINPEKIAGIIAEPVPGWATWPMPQDFAREMKEWAGRNDILITFDEVQAGCGRTGRFFAFEHLGVIPDLITLGKGLTSSLPVSAVIGSAWLMDKPGPGQMSSTHSGNPVCAAAALACLEVLEEEKLIEASAENGRLVLERLLQLQSEFPEHFFSVHGRGLFISAHLKKYENGKYNYDIELADAIVDEAVRRGVMMFPTHRGFLKIAPPLCIDLEAALEAVNVIRDCFLDLK